MGGASHCYEPSRGAISTVRSGGSRIEVALRFLGYEGLPLSDRLSFSRFMGQSFLVAMSGEDLTQHDDICFNTYAVEHGLPRHVTRYSMFRMLREAFFNFCSSRICSRYACTSPVRAVNTACRRFSMRNAT